MTDFFGSVRNIELLHFNNSSLPTLEELSGQTTLSSARQTCQSSPSGHTTLSSDGETCQSGLPLSFAPPPLTAVS